MIISNKEKGLLFIIVANIVFTIFYYAGMKNDSSANLMCIPVIALVVLAQFIIFVIGRKMFENKKLQVKYYDKFLFITTITLLIIEFVIIFNLYSSKIDSYKIVSLLISYMIIYIGNIMPQIKQNSIIGIRTKKTLSDPDVWKKVNRTGGITLVIAGVILFIICLILSGKKLIIITLFGIIAWSILNDIYKHIL